MRKLLLQKKNLSLRTHECLHICRASVSTHEQMEVMTTKDTASCIVQAQRKKQSQKAAKPEILHLLKNANIVARRTPKAHGIAKPRVNNSEHVANCTTTQACANLRHACTLRQTRLHSMKNITMTVMRSTAVTSHKLSMH